MFLETKTEFHKKAQKETRQLQSLQSNHVFVLTFG